MVEEVGWLGVGVEGVAGAVLGVVVEGCKGGCCGTLCEGCLGEEGGEEEGEGD